MNEVRAKPFLASQGASWRRQADWLKLPSDWALDRVVGVALDSRGYVYVAHRGAPALWCVRPDGTVERTLGSGALRPSVAYDLRGPKPVPMAERIWLHGLTVDHEDQVWVTDVSRHLVFKFDRQGELMRTWGVDGEPGCDERHFFQPTHVCVQPNGEFFVTDGYGNARVVHFDAQGRFVNAWGRAGVAPGEFHTPHVIVSASPGELLVSDRENDRIQIFDTEGRVQAVWSGLHSVDGLCSARDGRGWWGSSGLDGALVRLDAAGKVVGVWADPGRLIYPHAVAQGPDGAVYLADTGDRWLLDPATAEAPRPTYRLEERSGGQGSALHKYWVEESR